MLIVLNGRNVFVETPSLSYEEIVGLAKVRAGATVTWKLGGTRDGGELMPGAAIPVRRGLIVNAIVTG
jgi:hypothetical protein